MDAPLAQCTREEQRAVVRFLWSEGHKDFMNDQKDFMNDFLSRAKTDLQRLCYLINGNAPVSQNHLLSLLNLLFTGGG